MSTTRATWLFDLGNSRLKGAVSQAKDWSQQISLAWDAAGFDTSLRVHLGYWPSPAKILIASVVSAARTQRLRDALQGLTQAPQRWLQSPRQACGITNRYRDPSRLGIDRFLAMAAARAASNGSSVVVIGCGTAMTLDAVDASGAQQEGLIAPSPQLMLRSLRGATALDENNPAAFAAEDADDSARALRRGCMRAATSLVQWHYARHRDALDDPQLWLHGGGAAALLETLEPPARERARLLEDAVLRGLLLWVEQHGEDS